MSLEPSHSPDDSVIDLAHEADFLLGSLTVSPSSREVIRGGGHEALEPRVMQVLVALFQANGRVVSRDDLIARCWEGRIVGEDAINRAIWRLRKLAEADGDANFTIETIPRVGYRLVGAIETGSAAVSRTVEGGKTTALPGFPPAAGLFPRRRRWRLVAGMALLAVTASVAAAWLLWPERHWTVESSRPFISTLALEDYPAFSPNGAMLAYTSGPAGGHRQIYVRNLAGGEGIRITNDAYDDTSPTWSSDGARLAYVAMESGGTCRIMVAAFPTGEAREAGRCRTGEQSSFTWQPGTSFVYFHESAGLKGNILYRLDLDTGARLAVQKMALRDGITSLRCSPDGKWLAYFRWSQGIIIRDLSSGREIILGNFPLRASWNVSLAWAEGSRAVLAGIAGAVGGSKIVAYPLGGAAPYQVYATAMKIGNLAAGGDLLALETDISRSSLARASATAVERPDIIDPANGITWSPSFAPDGTLAFLSNRSGTNAIWLMKKGAAPAMLFDGGFSPLYRLRFSPDGALLAVASDTPQGATIKIMTQAGASLSSFDVPSLGLGLPSWTLDSKSVIVFDRHSLRTLSISISNPAQRVPFAAPHWVGITVREDGTFATRVDARGIWRIDKVVKQISNTHPTPDSPLAFSGGDVLVPEYDGSGVPRILAQPLSGGPTRVIGYAPGAADQNGFHTSFAVNPASGEIVYVAAAAHDTNIDLLTLTRR